MQQPRTRYLGFRQYYRPIYQKMQTDYPKKYLFLYYSKFAFRNATLYNPSMASSRDFLDFVLEQLSGLPDISYRAMMGEYIIYYRGKVIGGIYDNRLLIKPMAAAAKILADAPMEIPYDGGRPMIMVTDIENSELLERLFNAVYPELPETKHKPKE